MDKFINIYLKWEGRISRKTYWIYAIPILLVFVANELLITHENEIIYIVVWVLIFYPAMMINIKRCHDRGKTGFFSILLLVPIISLWPLIELGFIKSKDEGNKFGDPDKTWENT